MSNSMIIHHGSHNSLDKDIYVVIDTPLTLQQAKEKCESYVGFNANLICIEDGEVSWCYKGTTDECNNSILATFNLHKQTCKCPITQYTTRRCGIKLLRTIRGLLSYASRTQYRQHVKNALSCTDINYKINTLKMLDLNSIEDFKKTSLIETYKFYAFQLAQTYALLDGNVELFTKDQVCDYFPELSPYINREEASPSILQKFFNEFIQFFELYIKQLDENVVETYYNGMIETIEIKNESIIKITWNH